MSDANHLPTPATHARNSLMPVYMVIESKVKDWVGVCRLSPAKSAARRT